MNSERLLVDAGTSYTKILRLGSGERSILRAKDAKTLLADKNVVAATGHLIPGGEMLKVNELVALAEGGMALIGEPDFTLLDCGARDVKYVKVSGRRVVGMDWNTECGAFTGQVIELLARYFEVDPTAVPRGVEKIPVVCGVLGMTNMFDLISQGVTHETAFGRFLRGIAFNCERLVGRPGKIFLSGGLCENAPFLESFSCEAVPLGRHVLLEGLKRIYERENGA